MRIALLLIGLLFLTACGPAPVTVPDSAAQQLQQLSAEYVSHYWQSYPEQAVNNGLTDYHGRLPDYRHAALQAQQQQLQLFEQRLQAIDSAALTAIDDVIDYELLQRHIAIRLAELSLFPKWQREPGRYLAFNAFTQTLNAEAFSAEQRAQWLLAMLAQLPAQLDAGKVQLTQAPRRYVEDSIRSVQVQRTLFSDTLPQWSKQLPEPLAARLQQAAAEATVALDAWLAFLQQLAVDNTRAVAAGPEVYDFYLRALHGLELNHEQLLAQGYAYFELAEQELEAQAKRIDPSRSWQQITEQIRDQHPQKDQLLSAYCEQISRARAHVIQANLAMVPEQEQVLCIESQPDQRAFSPFGVFSRPAPYSSDKTGYLILHPIPDGLSAEREQQLLRAHDSTWLQVIAAHEAYPGHHLQALHAQMHQRPLRHIYSTPVFTEGWGLYTEELMYERGFFQDPELTRLTQLRLRLWRAARVILDVSLHTGKMDEQAARTFLHERTGMEWDATRGEVGIYLYRPSYAIGYIVGYYELMAVRQAYLEKHGEGADLRQFHDHLLSLGAIPFGLVRKALAL